jgi:hypothetical protein
MLWPYSCRLMTHAWMGRWPRLTPTHDLVQWTWVKKRGSDPELCDYATTSQIKSNLMHIYRYRTGRGNALMVNSAREKGFADSRSLQTRVDTSQSTWFSHQPRNHHTRTIQHKRAKEQLAESNKTIRVALNFLEMRPFISPLAAKDRFFPQASETLASAVLYAVHVSCTRK